MKYLRSSLSEALGVETFAGLTKVINEDKIFVNPELTLAELAQTLNVHPHNLSQVINTFEGKSFYDYINLKRIEEFKRVVALPENRKFTLLALAHDCGFNSKTSFNRNFKNLTGLSPSEYLRQNSYIKLEQ
ncbi:MAG: helix-turn-helix domain-containing protein [Cytophagales bacterium]|nr:helix-turn-helix domain-containing protein [Cytophagales bacterium]